MASLQIYSNTTLPVNLEILSLSPLLVSEGKHVLITSENIAMVLDIAKYGVEETGVTFTLVTPPTYGTLALDLLTSRNDHSFTLQDINQDKVTAKSASHRFTKFSKLTFNSFQTRRSIIVCGREISVHPSITRVTLKLEIAKEFAGARVRDETRSACT